MLSRPSIDRIQHLQAIMSTAMQLAVDEMTTDPVDASYRIHQILASLPDKWREIDQAVYRGVKPNVSFGQIQA